MELPTAHILARIAAIQERIDTLTGGPPAAPQTVSGGPSFADLLGTTSGGSPEIGPDGTPVRPLGPEVASYSPEISAAAAKYQIDPNLVSAVMTVESNGNPRAVSRAGAMGLMQLMPANVAEAGVSDPFDPAQNIDAGTRQLASLMSEFGGNLDLALAAYNAGPGAVKRFGGIPPYPETQNYVRKIRALLDGS
jgi:soluble lytic murein transglycosylase-like protein